TYNNLGVLLNSLGASDDAFATLSKELPIRENLAREFPGTHAHTVDLAGVYLNLGNAVQGRNQPEAALEWYAKALAQLAPVLATEPRLALARRAASRSHMARAVALDKLGRYPEALKAWDRALDFDDGHQPAAIRQDRAVTLARMKEPAPADPLV